MAKSGSIKEKYIPLWEVIQETLHKKHPHTVEDMIKLVRENRPSVSVESILRYVKGLRDEGTVELRPTTPSVRSFSDYLRLQIENSWFYAVIACTLGVLATVYLLPATSPIIMFRWVLGCIFILFLPGYALVQALFPDRKELDGITRVAFSVGLSIAVVALVGVLLNYTPWGIRLNPVLVSLSIFTIVSALIGSYRRYFLIANV